MIDRKYKFRCFSLHSYKMDYPYEEDYGVLLDGADGLIPLQFTGSNDSAQNPIYEGDVVLWHTEDPFDCTYFHKKMVVGWNQRCMQFRLYEFPNEVGAKAGETFWPEDVRVIGHIFDYENEECRYHLDESVKDLVKQTNFNDKSDETISVWNEDSTKGINISVKTEKLW